MCGVFHWAMGVVLGASQGASQAIARSEYPDNSYRSLICAGDRTFGVQGTPIFPNLSQFEKATSGLCDL